MPAFPSHTLSGPTVRPRLAGPGPRSGLADRIRTLRVRVLLALAALLATVPALAVDESDLLPVDQAFVLKARALDRDRIELRTGATPARKPAATTAAPAKPVARR